MSESPRSQSVVVGLFVLIGLVVLAGAVLAIGDPEDLFADRISVRAEFDGVSGLQVGNNVWFSGVKVGTVREMRFTAERRVEVVLAIDPDAAPYIREDSLAKIGSDGLIGNRIVVLYGGTEEAGAITDGDVLTVGDAVTSEDIMLTAQQNNENLLAITNDLKVLSSKLVAGEGTAGKLLSDQHLHDEALSATASIGDAADRIGVAARSFDEAAKSADQMVGTLNTFAETLDRDGTAVLRQIRDSAADPETPIGLALTDEQAAKDLAATLDNLKDSSALLEEDLEAVQHNFLFRRYFRRRASQQQPPPSPSPSPDSQDQDSEPISP
jgi:phospholipid/cholesterol/gamma-HCH transport system substrate-binding protein